MPDAPNPEDDPLGLEKLKMDFMDWLSEVILEQDDDVPEGLYPFWIFPGLIDKERSVIVVIGTWAEDMSLAYQPPMEGYEQMVFLYSDRTFDPQSVEDFLRENGIVVYNPRATRPNPLTDLWN